MVLEAVVRHFDRAAPRYGRFRNIWPLKAIRRSEQNALKEFARVHAGDRVLDAGCGDGETLVWLGACGARPVGIDVAFAMTSLCREHGFDVCVQDLEHPGFRASFDWVLCVGTLEFTRRPAVALRNLAACLRPGGRFVLLFPHRGPMGVLYAAYHRTHGIQIRLFSFGEVHAWMSAAGLQPDEQRWKGWLSTVVAATKPKRE
jgi:SAM-dependent methyltransferase